MPHSSLDDTIIDIRSSTDGIDMRNDLLQKLRPGDGEEKKIPTILLYDEIGLKLFEDITYLDEVKSHRHHHLFNVPCLSAYHVIVLPNECRDRAPDQRSQ
jgi:hypothetical protein